MSTYTFESEPKPETNLQFDNPQEVLPQPRLPIPYITFGIIAMCFVIFIGVNIDNNGNRAFINWVAPNIYLLTQGRIWGVFTSSFTHQAPMHIFFNMYWAWTFGKLLESHNWKSYLALVLTSAIAGSLIQLAVSGQTGIGYSGVVYSMFGYIYVLSKLDKDNWYMPQSLTVQFIGWGILCVVLTYAHVWNIGNGAHFGGLAWGALLAYLTKFKDNKAIRLGLPLVIVLSLFSPLLFAKDYSDWWAYRGVELHDAKNIEGAKEAYGKAVSINPDNEIAKLNLRYLEIFDQLNVLNNKGDVEGMKTLCKELTVMEVTDEWVKNCAAGFPKTSSNTR